MSLYQIQRLKFHKIEEIEFNYDILQEVRIEKEGVEFCFKIHLKRNNDKLIVFSNGAVDPNKSELPVYMRSSWSENISASSIYLDDPTLHDTKMRLGWGQGVGSRFYLEEFAEILKKLFDILSIKYKNIIFYGSSAGGFMSMILSILIEDSIAVVNNPQTNVLNYLRPYVKRMLSHSYSIDDIESVESNILYRLDVVAAVKHYGKLPGKLYYFQNYKCEGDIDKHQRPFVKKLEAEGLDSTNLFIINYFDEKLGHNPLQKNKTIKILNLISEDKYEFNV